MDENAQDEKAQTPAPASWHEALDPRLSGRLLRPLSGPGRLPPPLARRVFTRTERMLQRLPLLDGLRQRLDEVNPRGLPLIVLVRRAPTGARGAAPAILEAPGDGGTRPIVRATSRVIEAPRLTPALPSPPAPGLPPQPARQPDATAPRPEKVAPPPGETLRAREGRLTPRLDRVVVQSLGTGRLANSLTRANSREDAREPRPGPLVMRADRDSGKPLPDIIHSRAEGPFTAQEHLGNEVLARSAPPGATPVRDAARAATSEQNAIHAPESTPLATSGAAPGRNPFHPPASTPAASPGATSKPDALPPPASIPAAPPGATAKRDALHSLSMTPAPTPGVSPKRNAIHVLASTLASAPVPPRVVARVAPPPPAPGVTPRVRVSPKRAGATSPGLTPMLRSVRPLSTPVVPSPGAAARSAPLHTETGPYSETPPAPPRPTAPLARLVIRDARPAVAASPAIVHTLPSSPPAGAAPSRRALPPGSRSGASFGGGSGGPRVPGPRGPGRGPGPGGVPPGSVDAPSPLLSAPVSRAGGSASSINLEELTDKVHQRLLRQLNQERERRGLTR